MSSKITKGMLLAAGLGTRLRPLTETIPKPMLTVGGHPLIAYSLGLLQRAGITDVVINLHHLGNQVREYCKDGAPWGMRIRYSEEPIILGSGGGLKQAASLIGNEPFVAVNADTLLDIDLQDMMAAHNTAHAGLMVLVPVTDSDHYGRVGTTAHGYLSEFGTGHHTFAGVQIVTPQLIAQLPEGVSCVIKNGYQKLLQQGNTIDCYIHTGYWNDIGTPERYAQTQADFAAGKIKICPVEPI